MKMLNVKEAARRLGISPSTLYAMTAARRLAHYRIGDGKILFAESDVDAYLQRCRVEPRTAAAPSAPPPRLIRPPLKHLRCGPLH